MQSVHDLEIRPVADAPGYLVRADGIVIGPKGHIRKTFASNAGYLMCSSYGGRGKNLSVHRVMAIAFLGDPPTAHHTVAHIDGNQLNNHRNNLRWATLCENHLDKREHGTANRGYGHLHYIGYVPKDEKTGRYAKNPNSGGHVRPNLRKSQSCTV